MPNPELDNGFTRIANEILEAMACAKLNGTQSAIVMTIWRYTYGFQRKSHEISLTFLAQATGKKKKLISKELNNLKKKNMVIVEREATFSKPQKIGFNKNVNEWGQSGNQGTVPQIGDSTVPQMRDSTVPQMRDSTVPQIGDQERKKERSKENIYTHLEQMILDHWNSKGIIEHQPTDGIQKAISAALKKHGKDKVVLAIDNYNTVYRSDFYYSHKWRLDKFLKQANGLPDFLDDGQVWINYLAQTGGRSRGGNLGRDAPLAPYHQVVGGDDR